MPRSVQFELVPDHQAEGVARICGPHSAYAKALEGCRIRRAAGEAVHIWRAGSMILVGPDPQAEAPSPVAPHPSTLKAGE